MGQIAVALKHLMAAGLSGDDLVSAIQEIEDAAPVQVDEQAERRRAKDRERKKKAREAEKVRGNPQMSADSADNSDKTLSPLVPPLSPTPPNPPYNPPIPAQSSCERAAGDFELTPPQQPKPKRTARANGQRLDKDWQPTPKDLAFATKHGLTPEEIEHEANRFRDTWVSKPGKDGRKLDWEATWRNWITNPDLGPVARKAREAKRSAPRSGGAYAQAKPRSGGIAAAGMRAVAEARGYGE